MARRKASAPMKAPRVAILKPRPATATGGPPRGAEAARLRQGHQGGNGGNGKG